ncbi:DEAD/DEAH box helicase [Campylobacter fetus]|uniref:DEAD/DEAH box helicase n=1 Tax=Campylobacter fetus TaxID=196 RepID=UPI0003C2723E|nr:DEAD/DEAH box helicase [Campylobacter fetus]AGZ81595.1 transcription-repair coupling factor [Campylobacter fetus subsp. testudinum 03-427]EAI4321428.1 DEAD/DEAH box helicase [Campylobacter fetus]EAI4390684.1 DEAD/DEAH box helicase [Campylobacter fetus]OCS07645.1 transcription-repair coupling factor [Campylobacter fetus subsp. testudinum]OCS09034.1 transcription-repair coupling factor [Campylobacter fetus subsp. testudinum]
MQARIYEFFKFNKNIYDILVTNDDKEAREAYDSASYAGLTCFVLPDFRAVKGDDLRAFNTELLEISKVLTKFYKSDSKNKLLISPIRTLLNKLPTSSNLKTKTVSYADTLNLTEFKEEMLGFGYNFVDIVEGRGEIRISGEIIDIFSISEDKPIRILLDIDTVCSIRYFDLDTQKSDKNELTSVTITPFLASLNSDELKDINDKLENIDSNALIKDINSFGFWVIDGFSDYFDSFKTVLATQIDIDDIVSNRDLSFLNTVPILPEPKIYKDLEVSVNSDLIKFHSSKKIQILSSNESSFNALNLENSSNVELVISNLILNIASKDELILSLNKRVKKQRVKKASLVIDELKAGDFIVHSDYGIGKFLGLELITVLGSKKEFVVIAYQNDDKLLLPVEHLNMIDRYIAGSGAVVSVDRLGKASFAKIKEKVREKLFIIASKIIALAAKRELIEGIRLNADSKYAEFKSSAGFLYTDDQEKAVNDIQNHLNSGRVMDMLLSGDVGFGKTEVAMNAIYLCVKSGYQALFFVPTTLLSSQHYKSLKERLGKFDIEVKRLDRFTSAKEKSLIIKDLNDAKPMVLIGTHALLSLKAVNLGLIIIDEEHKFGVKQKEKLKEISEHSHILSMSATPIPRSLNMALSKVKSYSTLTTPPIDRMDVRTFVKEWDEKLVKEVILREMRRGGQIFYVHNLISDIPSIEIQLKALIPNLKVLTLHSKIDTKTTEDEMIKFANKEYDLLLCTSIIESGIHLPNANTIIIDDANKFGIADLHQLRGRVGRSNKQGYCYFLVGDKNELSSEAVKRLIALESNSFLGSGALLAYHDLEIRGGGNLVGEAQSGHIEAIGYTLYLKMLEDEINALLNHQTKEMTQIDIKLSVNAFLNADLINEDRIRLELYRRLSKCQNVSEVYEIGAEIEDRFGKLDAYTKQFLDIIVIKILACEQGFKSVSNYEQNISLTKIDGTKVILKSRSKDDDVLAQTLVYLRKNSS